MTKNASNAALELALARRHTMFIEPSRTMRGPDAPWDHTFEIALPTSYYETNRAYPVLWVTDGSEYFAAAASLIQSLAYSGLIPEVIVVGVGCERDLKVSEFARRRA